MFDTSSQSFQRQDDQEVHVISCFLSEADEMQYIQCMCTLENDVIHVHCKRSFLAAMVARDFDIIWDEVPTMVEISIFSTSLMAYIPCTVNDTSETNTWINLQKIGCAVIWKGAGRFVTWSFRT